MTKLNSNTVDNFFKAILISLSLLIVAPVMAETAELPERLASDKARDVSSKPAEIIEFVGVSKGDRVLDFLGGGGYYSQLLKRVVGKDGAVVSQNGSFCDVV